MKLNKLVANHIPSCPACGSPVKKPWLGKEIAGVKFNLDKCCACGTGYVNPQPSAESLKSLYACRGHGSNSLTSFEQVMISEVEFPNSTVDAQRLVTYAKELLGPCQAGKAKALDIGSGYGFFSKAALEQGFQVIAVNPASAENRIFKQLNGLEPIPRFFEEVDFDTEKFDLVILSQVLEHLLDPFQVLVKVRNLIKPEGVIAIAVPNVDAILIKILKSRSSFLGLPEHIIHFSRQGLSAILQRAGFEVKLHRYISRIPYYSISNRLNIQGRSRKLVNYFVRISQWAPLCIANRLGVGLFQNVWAVPIRPDRETI
jgi:2-polyprenyl-3-methyl-5-hydroxy-6-metoxy-1,4-benzoquinol methylase